jgi:two-component system, OmpR family, phosphate regulon sensor histidine kinase PhoR
MKVMAKKTAKPTAPTSPAEHVASLEHERLTALINSMADGVIALDASGKVAVYNGAALNILDINKELSGKNLKNVIELVDKTNQPVSVSDLIAKAAMQYTTRDLRLKYPNDELINLYLSIAPVHLGYGVTGQRGYVLLLRDITREKSLEEERDEFISVVSHELRTPIAIAEGNISNAQLIVSKTHGVPDGVTSSLNAAYEQTIFLSGMINDLATLSRAERNKLEVEIEPINPHDLLHDLVHNYEPQAKEKDLKLTGSTDPELVLLYSSKLYVREILQNFITNAIKYTQTGSVHIAAHNHPKGTKFEVTDTGIGISKADKERVFDKFFRSEDFRTRQSSGTGLGLYVTMKLARLIHAEIDLESELNKGSTFSIIFPTLEVKDKQ